MRDNREKSMMNYYFYKAEKDSFDKMVICLLEQYHSVGIPIRLVFFGSPRNNDEYLSHYSFIMSSVAEYFKENIPLVSYVAQVPCHRGLDMEVHELSADTGKFEYQILEDISYIVVKGKDYKWLFLGGMQGDILHHDYREQAAYIFGCISRVLEREQLFISDIVRQWNYIEGITEYDEHGHQHYQDFNDVRSAFYLRTEWDDGYPAATGIGALCGGIVIDVDILGCKNGTVSKRGIDNPLQIAAHAYSQEVLYGETRSRLRTTPKFERAKLLQYENSGLIYISGTAAIRGEHSLENVDIAGQTLATLENIEYLISTKNLEHSGVMNVKSVSLKNLRVYVKHGQDWEICKKIVESRYPDLPVIYLFTDICRRELLVEIEGIAHLRNM